MAAALMKNPNLDNKLPDNYIDNDFLTYLEEQGFEVQYIVGDGNWQLYVSVDCRCSC